MDRHFGWGFLALAWCAAALPACSDDSSGDEPTGGVVVVPGPGGAGGAMVITGGTGGAAVDTGGTGGAAVDTGGTGGAAAGAGGDGSPTTTLLASIAGGAFAGLTGYESTTATGFAIIERESAGGTTITLEVSGLTASTDYPAHLHALPCAMQGGGHYKIDPSVMDTVEENELWPTFTTDADGRGTAQLTSAHLARADGMSVVVHDPGAMNAKMLCADLTDGDATPTTLSGDLAPFAAAEMADQGISGGVSLEHIATGTRVAFNVTGLSATDTYPAHVHALPCGVMDAGSHYKIDPTVMDTVDSNELWPMITPDATGSASGMFESPHDARPDAQSVVIHRTTTDAAIKVACADLAAPGVALSTSGEAQTLPDATTMGLDSLTGSATLTRNLDGSTAVSVQVANLTANTEFPIHVHDRACAAMNGGGHYKIDTSITEAMEPNELWLTLTTADDGSGSREVMVMHRTRAEAQSVVIHAPGGERLACIDLTL